MFYDGFLFCFWCVLLVYVLFYDACCIIRMFECCLMLSDKKEVVCLAVLRPVTDPLLLLVVGMTKWGGGTASGRLFFIGRALVNVGATVGRLFPSVRLIVNYQLSII